MRVCIAIFFLLLLTICAAGQNGFAIEGDNNPQLGVSNQYHFWSDVYYFATKPTWSVSPSGGVASVGFAQLSSDRYSTWVNITFNTAGAATITLSYSGSVVATMNVVAGLPGAPTFNIDTPVCGSGSATISATPGSGGNSVRWYTSASGGSYVQGLTYNTPNLTSGTTYYITSVNTTSNAESAPRTPVSVPVNPFPGAPTTPNDPRPCVEGEVVLSIVPASPATSIKWYSAPTESELVHIGTSFPVHAVQTAKYYYAASFNTSTGCESTTRTLASVSVARTPEIMLVQAEKVYGSGSVEFTAYNDSETDTETKWYASQANAEANTSALATGITYQTPVLSSTAIYYLRTRNTVNNCVSPVMKVTAEIIPLISPASVKQEIIRVAGVKTEASIAGLPANQKTTTHTFVDGVGRVAQQVVANATPLGNNLVSPVEYDSYGRTSKQYLMYATAPQSEVFRSAYKAEQADFYDNTTDNIADDDHPYAVAAYETSPLGRVTEQGGAGTAWQPGQNHTNKVVYNFNNGATNNRAEEVRKFNADGSSTGFYPANKLHRIWSSNAQGNIEIVYKDINGRVIAKKTQLNETVEGVVTDYIETYYYYDDFGNLLYIIQPKGVKALKSVSWTISATIKDQYFYQYVYDKRGRVIEKKVPGAGWEYIVYDQLNRPVLTQSANLRAANKWMFIKYDSKGRAILSGIYTDNTNTTRSALQDILDLKNYDLNDKYFEVRQSGTTHGYSNLAFPVSNIDIRSVNYYDDQDFDYNGTADQTYTVPGLPGQAVAASPSHGMATGSKVVVEGTTDWLRRYVFYDQYGRVIQTKSNSHKNLNVNDHASVAYDFEKPLYSKVYHNGGSTQVTIVTRTEYDDMARIRKLFQSLNGGAEQLVARYDYNELGQLVDKKLHGTGSPGAETFLQSVDFRYDIQGRLLSINNAELTTGANNDETGDLFGIELAYEKVVSGLSNSARFDGNISALRWKGPGVVSGAQDQRSYKFSYDKSGKMKTATYQMRGATAWNAETNAQNETVTYDLNGNIKTFQRHHRKYQFNTTTMAASYVSEAMDNLTYTYSSTDANRLMKVTDAALTSGFNNGTSGTSNDFTYDAEGNLLTDANKGISSTTYNFLGKPTVINFSDGRKLEYVYDAVGVKLTMKTYAAGNPTPVVTDYVGGGFVYVNNALSFFGSPEGRVVKSGSVYEYQYAIADHQGNTRVVFSSAEPEIREYTATFENPATDAEEFMNIPDALPYWASFTAANSTPGGIKVVRMNQHFKTGPAKKVAVYPGDKIEIDVWTYYENSSGFGTSTPALQTLITSVAGAFGGSAAASGESLQIYNGVSSALTGYGTGGNRGATAPAAYLNYIIFDKNYNVLDMGWQPATGLNTKQQIGFPVMTIREPGYVFVYLSYENDSDNYVQFDDLHIKHTPTNVIQYNEYYPYGLQTGNSWTRDDHSNNYLYNAGNELNPVSGWYEMFYRGYDPALGRMLQVDPYAVMYASHTGYNYAVNNPVLFNDKTGGKVSLQGALNSIVPTSRYMARVYENWGNDWYGGMYGFSTHNGSQTYAEAMEYYGRSGGATGPLIFSIYAKEYVRAYEVLAWDASNQNADYRAFAQQAVDVFEMGMELDLSMFMFAQQGDAPLNKDQLSGFEKALVAINEWNPVANAYDALLGYFTGKDRFDDPISTGGATWKAAGVIPIGKVFKVGKLLVRSDALTHIFRNAVGHVNPTFATSQVRYLNLFSNVASNPANLVRTVNPEAAKAGVQTFMQTFNNGTVWVQVRNGVIFDAGVNLIP